LAKLLNLLRRDNAQSWEVQVLTTFEIDGTKLAEVESKLNIMESVMRYIVVKQD